MTFVKLQLSLLFFYSMGKNEENDGQGRKGIDLNPKSIAEFLEKQEGIKNDFTKPHMLCVNYHEFKRKGRDDAMHQTYDYIFDRYCKIRKLMSEGRDVDDKILYPLLALQAAPGGGKSFFLDELASLRSEDLDRYLEKKQKEEQGNGENQQYAEEIVDILRGSVGICITYNGSSPYVDYIDDDLRRGLAMRILWSYFFNKSRLSWYAFCNKFKSFFDSLNTLTAIQSIIYHSKKSVFLCVDEVMKVFTKKEAKPDNIKKILNELYMPYHDLSSSDRKFHFVMSTLDALNMFETQTDSQRPINWIPLRRLDLTESEQLFLTHTENLENNRLFIIRKCIVDCNGHPRSLEKFYELLFDKTALLTDSYNSLIERLAKNLYIWFGSITFSIVKTALLGNKISLMSEIETNKGKKSTLRNLISTGIYINSLTDVDETFRVTPTLSPVCLQYFYIFNDKSDDAITVAKILRDLLSTENSFDDEVMDGKPFERFHANWELLYRALHDDGEEVDLYKIYGFIYNSDQLKIEMKRKKRIARLENLEFPPSDEICDTEGKSIKDFVNYVLVPTKSNHVGFDMMIFERKARDTGYIAINIECKFSYPGNKTKLTNSEIKNKYENTRSKYYNHVRYESKKTRKSFMNWQEGKFYDKSAVGKLKMTINDVYLVFVAWREVEPLDDEIKKNKNIIIVEKENLEEIYTPSLVARPQFYEKIKMQFK